MHHGLAPAPHKESPISRGLTPPSSTQPTGQLPTVLCTQSTPLRHTLSHRNGGPYIRGAAIASR